jgi:hypothetical protein
MVVMPRESVGTLRPGVLVEPTMMGKAMAALCLHEAVESLQLVDDKSQKMAVKDA